VPFDRTAEPSGRPFDTRAPEAGIQHERFDVAHEPDRSVHLGLDVVIQRVPVAGFSQSDERHRRGDPEIRRFEEAVGVAERRPGERLRPQAKVR